MAFSVILRDERVLADLQSLDSELQVTAPLLLFGFGFVHISFLSKSIPF